MKRLPLLPTLLVGLAIAVMIALGVWQLCRKAEKEALLARYAAARDLPPVTWPGTVRAADAPLFRRSMVQCSDVSGWRTEAGRSSRGDAGWVHIASCGNGSSVVVGWSERPENPRWSGGPVRGVIGPDREGVRLIADTPAASGLAAPRLPSPDDVPNNHLFYALQWFFFAGAAGLIYVLALRRRRR